jgi:endonuclease YncB( thermonuclease family)
MARQHRPSASGNPPRDDAVAADVRRRVPRAPLFGAIFLGLAALLIVTRYFVGGLDEKPGAILSDPAPPPDRAATAASEPGVPSTSEAEQRPVRDVTPQGVLRVYMDPAATPGKRTPTTSMRIEHAGVTPGGAIAAEDRTVRLHGVAFLEPRKICTDAAGEKWACGRRAYIALHNKIAAQTVHCEPRQAAEPRVAAESLQPTEPPPNPPAADCFIGDVNLAAWLLAQGLARLQPDVTDKELVAAEASARTARLGLWSDPGEAPAAASAQ